MVRRFYNHLVSKTPPPHTVDSDSKLPWGPAESREGLMK